MEFLLVIRLTVEIVTRIDLFIVEAGKRCAARNSAGIKADNLVAVEERGAKDVLGGVVVINA